MATRVDPYRGFNFLVEIDGITQAGFQECSGLDASTDPVALDVVGWELIEKLRKENSLPTLEAAARKPTYIQNGGELGLGVFDKNAITPRDVTI